MDHEQWESVRTVCIQNFTGAALVQRSVESVIGYPNKIKQFREGFQLTTRLCSFCSQVMVSAEVMKIGPGAGMDASGVGVPAIGWQSEVVLVLHVLASAWQHNLSAKLLPCCILGFAL